MSGAQCEACGHTHAGIELGYICIGCPCPEQPGIVSDLHGAMSGAVHAAADAAGMTVTELPPAADEPPVEEPVWKRMAPGLKQGPRVSDWDPALVLYGCDDWSARFGVRDGWRWATDQATALVERADGVDDKEDGRAIGLDRLVLNLVHGDWQPPIYTVRVSHLSALGGIGQLASFGTFDLDRVRDAAMWVLRANLVDEDDERSLETIRREAVIASEPHSTGRIIRIAGGPEPTRVAAVMSTNTAGWVPTIDIPLAERTGDVAAIRAE